MMIETRDADGETESGDPLVDRSGREIRFTYLVDCEPPNRGFIEDRMTAWHGDVPVGYVRCEYLTEASVSRYLPSVLHYASTILGMSILPDEDRDLLRAGPEEVAEIARRLRIYRLTTLPDPVPTTWSELLSFVEGHGGRRVRAVEADFTDFLKRVDRPFVSYACTAENRSKGLASDDRGLGIGTELYRRLALELDRRGLRLRSSTLRSADADRVWEGLTRRGWTEREGDRHVLVPDRLRPEPDRPTYP